MNHSLVEAGEGASVSLDPDIRSHFSPLSSSAPFVLLTSWQVHRIDQFLKYLLGRLGDSDEGLLHLYRAAFIEPYGGRRGEKIAL